MIEFKLDDANAFYSRARAQVLKCKLDLALIDLAEAIRLEPGEYRKLAATDSDFEVLR